MERPLDEQLIDTSIDNNVTLRKPEAGKCYVQVAEGHPRERDPTRLDLLIALPGDVAGRCQARIDTAASANFITDGMLEFLRQRTGEDLPTVDVDEDFRFFDGQPLETHHAVELTFRTGHAGLEYRALFDVVPSSVPDQVNGSEVVVVPSENQITDLILGAPWLRKNHVLMLDPDFDWEAPSDCEVLEVVPPDDVEKPLDNLGPRMPSKMMYGKAVNGTYTRPPTRQGPPKYSTFPAQRRSNVGQTHNVQQRTQQFLPG